MKGLTWYSVIVVAVSIIGLLIDVVAGNSTDVSIDLWGIFLYIPVFITLVLYIRKK